MNTQQLLNMDMTTLGGWLRRGLVWWVGELTDMTPAVLRQSPGRGVRPVAELDGDAVKLWRNGELLQTVREPSGVLRAVDLMLPADAALVQTLELPPLPASDLRTFLQLNMDRFTPFQSSEVYADALATPSATSTADLGGRQRVSLAVIVKVRAEALLQQLDDLGLRVVRMGLPAGGDKQGALQFDFMRQVRAERGGDPSGRRRVRLWIACAVALVANLAIAAARDIADVAQTQRLVDLQQPSVAMASRLRARISGERTRRLQQLQSRASHDPLRVLNAVTRALPAGQWVQRMEWNGRLLRLAGFRTAGFDVLAALKPPVFANPRSLTADVQTHAAAGDPFDVAVDVQPPRRP